jgi:hypothetical protein
MFSTRLQLIQAPAQGFKSLTCNDQHSPYVFFLRHFCKARSFTTSFLQVVLRQVSSSLTESFNDPLVAALRIVSDSGQYR